MCGPVLSAHGFCGLMLVACATCCHPASQISCLARPSHALFLLLLVHAFFVLRLPTLLFDLSRFACLTLFLAGPSRPDGSAFSGIYEGLRRKVEVS